MEDITSIKLEKLYMNSASTQLLLRYKNYFIQYKNKIFPNTLHIHLRACDAESSYNFTSPIYGSNIPKCDCILNCCSDFSRLNVLYLESSKQLDCLFPDFLHKIKFRIFKNISKHSTHGLRQLK